MPNGDSGYYEITTARFWTFINGGPVKISLPIGETLQWSKCQRTDEGWGSEAYRWSFEFNEVLEEFTSDGVDCDGRLSRHCDRTCPLDRLKRRIPRKTQDEEYNQNVNGLRFPAWEGKSHGQRDYAAEAMGY